MCVKPLSASYGSFVYSTGPTPWVVEDDHSSVCPSGFALDVMSEAIVPPAPPRFSTTTFWPMASVSF